MVVIYMNSVILDITALHKVLGLIYKHANLLNQMDSLAISIKIALLDHIAGI